MSFAVEYIHTIYPITFQLYALLSHHRLPKPASTVTTNQSLDSVSQSYRHCGVLASLVILFNELLTYIQAEERGDCDQGPDCLYLIGIFRIFTGRIIVILKERIASKGCYKGDSAVVIGDENSCTCFRSCTIIASTVVVAILPCRPRQYLMSVALTTSRLSAYRPLILAGIRGYGSRILNKSKTDVV